MDTRSKSKERAQAQEALAKARAVEDSEEITKKRIPITQAKLRRLNAKNSVKTALNQIRDAGCCRQHRLLPKKFSRR